jgi:hypothetical protein
MGQFVMRLLTLTRESICPFGMDWFTLKKKSACQFALDFVPSQKNGRGIDRQDMRKENARARFMELEADEWSFSPKSQRQGLLLSEVQDWQEHPHPRESAAPESH